MFRNEPIPEKRVDKLPKNIQSLLKEFNSYYRDLTEKNLKTIQKLSSNK